MNISTLFSIGQEIWVPRVYAEVDTDSVVVNGKTYYASLGESYQYTFTPAARKFSITEIELTVTAEVICETYYGKHIPDESDMREETSEYELVYSTTNKNNNYFFSKEDALKAAQILAEKKEPYYG